MKCNFGKVLVTAAILLPFLFASCKTTEVENVSEAGKEKQKVSLENFVEINEETDYLTTKISYPQFAEISGLSNKVKNFVESDWKSFKSVAEKEWNEINSLNLSAMSPYPPYEYYVTSKVSYSGDVVSIYLETYRFTGGAHGATSIHTFNYDRNTGKELSITEATGYSYEELSDICRKDLYKKLISDDKFNIDGETVAILDEMREEGTAPNAGNFENFTLDGNKLTVYFEQYTVAPGNYGIQKVETEF